MTVQDPVLRALRSFASRMGESYDPTEMCYELSEGVAHALGTTGAGVSVSDRDGRLSFATATSERIVGIERVQEEAQEGPCVSAFLAGEPVTVDDIREVGDWPRYTNKAEELELYSVIGYPLQAGDRRVGALNLYDSGPRGWGDSDLDVVGAFADMATAYLVRSTELMEARRLADQLQTALDSRVTVEQAKGMLAGEYNIGVDQAFAMLRRHARDNNLRLVDVCRAVIDLEVRIAARPEKAS